MTMKQPDTEVFLSEASAPTVAPGEIIIGTIALIDGQGQPRVDFPGNPSREPLAALSTLGITPAHVGRQVALLFAGGNPRSPVILGIIHSPLQDLLGAYDANAQDPAATEQPIPSLRADEVTVDGKRVVLEGKEEVVIKCGQASITLTRAGKILIRGNFLLSQASGVNRILGGSVQVN